MPDEQEQGHHIGTGTNLFVELFDNYDNLIAALIGMAAGILIGLSF
jgi:hypothetical protein